MTLDLLKDQVRHLSFEVELIDAPKAAAERIPAASFRAYLLDAGWRHSRRRPWVFTRGKRVLGLEGLTAYTRLLAIAYEEYRDLVTKRDIRELAKVIMGAE